MGEVLNMARKLRFIGIEKIYAEYLLKLT